MRFSSAPTVEADFSFNWNHTEYKIHECLSQTLNIHSVEVQRTKMFHQKWISSLLIIIIITVGSSSDD